ncbi:MAG: hypothetical protein KF842_03105 [Caulobacter sp.]|nr:hypothetical protein [Caulobacter sp.]
MKAWRPWLLAPLALLLVAWDTRVINGETWRSTYFQGSSGSIPEHTTLADMALHQLGVGDLFGKGGRASADLVDLNATYFRAELLKDSSREGDNRRTEVEERLLPAPAQFAGMPDYSYGPADWLNKNRVCPLGEPANDDALCHEFMGWMGGLNSVHFGSQATRMYAHYHELALQRASRARRLREQMSPGERQVYARALKESELQALMYEGYAQHFLQDRWAIGHMWERWDGPDRTQAAHPSPWGGVFVGGVAGLIHGAESVLNAKLGKGWAINADPMSSPLADPDGARPMTFVHAASPREGPINAVGDERLADLRRGAFGRGYGWLAKDHPIDVSRQTREMLTCSKAGWAEVIRAFGREEGGYGVFGAQLADGAPDFAVIHEASCWDMWATNRSMYVGFVGEGTTGISILGTLQVVTPPGVTMGNEHVFKNADLIALAWTMWRRQLVDPDGTDLARGGIGSLWGAPTGNAAGLPVYAEPIDPSGLPDRSRGGVDGETIYGAMSLAHSDHWCGEAGLEVLALLRRSDDPAKQQSCQFLADLAYQGTDPAYEGRMTRRRQADGKPVRSLCEIRGVRRTLSSGDPRDPVRLDQGYVSRTEARDRAPAFGSKPAANWCARTPIIRLSGDPALARQNIIQVLPSDAGRVELFGADFGAREGIVYIHEEKRGRQSRGRIVDWSDNRIQINLKPGDLKDGRDYLVEISTDDDRRSVGLFILRASRNEEAATEPAVAAAGCDGPPPPIGRFDAGAALTRRLGPDALHADPRAIAAAIRAVRAEHAATQPPLRQFLLKERACILSRQSGGELALSRIRTEALQRAKKESAAFFEAQQRAGARGGTWVGSCARSQDNGPVTFRPAYGATPFETPGHFWTDYAREIDGVLQYGRFAEVLMDAWALALETPGAPLAPDPALLKSGYDLRITSPQEVVRRYFRPFGGRKALSPLEIGLMRLQGPREVMMWSQGTLSLEEATFQGIVSRRAYETWLTTALRRQASDPVEAYCRVEAALTSPPATGASAAPQRGVYRSADGASYRWRGWPSLNGQASARTAPAASSQSGSPAPPGLPDLPSFAPPPTLAPPTQRPRRRIRRRTRRRPEGR